MIPQENYDTYYQHDSTSHMEQESIYPQTMEQKNAATSQHCSEERSADHQPTELDHDDADRRTLDEPQADEDEDEED